MPVTFKHMLVLKGRLILKSLICITSHEMLYEMVSNHSNGGYVMTWALTDAQR